MFTHCLFEIRKAKRRRKLPFMLIRHISHICRTIGITDSRNRKSRVSYALSLKCFLYTWEYAYSAKESRGNIDLFIGILSFSSETKLGIRSVQYYGVPSVLIFKNKPLLSMSKIFCWKNKMFLLGSLLLFLILKWKIKWTNINLTVS